MRLSVNILTWNNINVLKRTLQVLKSDLSQIEHEIIIVDNGSTDGCEHLSTIANWENLGISKGKNQGIDASKGDYIMLLDGDVLPVANSIPLLLDFIESYADVYAIGFRGNKWTREDGKQEKYCDTLFEPKIEESHCLFYGMFDREVFDKCRLDEETYNGEGYGSEDRDFYLQMKKEGFDQWFCGMNTNAGRYYHEINSSIRNMGRAKYMETSRKRHNLYLKKWGFVGT